MNANETWNYIVNHYEKNIGVREEMVQTAWENFFTDAELFQYSKIKGEVDSQRSIQIGSTERAIPDIILRKNNEDIAVIELKQYSLPFSEVREAQLFSYLKLLHIAIGVLVCDKIYLYSYDFDASKQDNRIEIPFERDNTDGIAFVGLFHKSNCTKENVERFINLKVLMRKNVSEIQKLLDMQFVLNAVKAPLVDKYTEEEVNYRKQTERTIFQEKEKEELKLFSYQEKAVQAWLEQDKSILLEMATGCGKTRTAIGCIKKAIEIEKKPLIIIIACPGNTLSLQWKDDIESLDVTIDKSIICDSTNSNKWRTQLEKLIKQLSTGLYKTAIAYTTHQTCSSKEFIEIISSDFNKATTFFIGDEVPGMGANKARNGLLKRYQYRLGLSATPSRWFDDIGTNLIENYFGNSSFVFTIHDALTTINPLMGKPFLVNYFYHPHFVSLTDDELEQYKILSDKQYCGTFEFWWMFCCTLLSNNAVVEILRMTDLENGISGCRVSSFL